MLPTDEKSTTEATAEKKKDEGENYLFIVLFYFLGTACFVPHSFYITANEYWMYKFRDPYLPFNETDTAEKTTLQKSFTAYVVIAGNIGMTTFCFLTSALHKKIELQRRIIGSMASLLILFAVTLMFVFIDTDSRQEEFFVIALVIGALLHGAAVLMVSVFELALKFRPRCLAAEFAGQSLCGIFSAAIQVVSLLVLPSVKGTAGLYYFIANAVLGSIMIAYMLFLTRSQDFRNQLRIGQKKVALEKKPEFTFSKVKDVFKKLYLFVLVVVISMGATTVLQPGLTTLIESSDKGVTAWGDTYFLPVCVFLLYNIFEFAGRETSNYATKWNDIKFILVAAIVRLALFPLILLCNLEPRHHLPVVFQDDAYFVIFLIVFAFAGGYFTNVVIVKHSEYCEPEEKVLGSATITLVMIIASPLLSLLSGVFVHLI